MMRRTTSQKIWVLPAPVAATRSWRRNSPKPDMIESAAASW